jgi:Bacterial Ig domain
MSQLGQIAQRLFNIVIQFFTKLIMGLTSHISPKLFSFYMLLFALITVMPCAPVFSANVSVTWNKNSESDLAGYKIYKRTLPSQDFGQPIFSGMPSNPSSPATTVSGLSGGTTYGFIATAFDTAGNESAPSTEKQISVPTGTPPPPSSLSISNLTVTSGQTYVVPTSGLQAGGMVYIDRSYTFTTVPALVQGAAYIRTANNDKAATNTTFLSFTVNQPVSVYVAHGNRITPKPAWLNTFTDTGANLVTSDTTLNLFVRTFPAGTITLGGNVSSGNAGNSLSMYSVIVKPDGGTPADTTAPTVTLTAPSAGTVSGTVTVSASASDNAGVTGVQFRLQGANLGAEDTTAPYSTSWNTTTVPNGSYTLTAIARDAAGNTKTSAPITVTVSNTSTPPADTTAPTVTLTAPSAGTVSGTVTVTASASDMVGVAGVQFRLQGANLGAEDTTNPYSTSWNTTTVPNGSYTLTAIARDAAGNTKTAAAVSVTVSNTSPPPPSGSSLFVNFQPSSSSVPSGYQKDDGSVYTSSRGYGWTTAVGTRERNVQSDKRLDTFIHFDSGTSVTWNYDLPNGDYLVSLASGDPSYAQGPHHITIEDITVINNQTTASNQFITITNHPITVSDGQLSLQLTRTSSTHTILNYVIITPASPDTTPPTVTLTAPSAGTVSGTVTVTASASDNIGVTGVQFRLQGANLGAEDTTNPYSTSWNTTTVPNGSYTLTAIARDAAGNTTTSAPRTVTVSNTTTPPTDTTAPTVTLTAPSAGTISGTVTVSASASDNVGVTGVQFRLQGANLGPEDTTNPYSTSWNTTTVPNGSYALTAIARDAAGNTTTSAPRTVTVSNTSTPPSSTLNISNLTVVSGQTYVLPSSGLQTGGTVYIDRAYTYTTVPTSVQGAAYIRTANNDKTATNAAFLSFTVNQPVSVFVAHDDRITPKPSWLNTFTDTGANLVTSDTTFSLFVRSFPAGTITLGGNVSSGTAGTNLSMYSVLIKP